MSRVGCRKCVNAQMFHFFNRNLWPNKLVGTCSYRVEQLVNSSSKCCHAHSICTAIFRPYLGLSHLKLYRPGVREDFLQVYSILSRASSTRDPVFGGMQFSGPGIVSSIFSHIFEVPSPLLYDFKWDSP